MKREEQTEAAAEEFYVLNTKMNDDGQGVFSKSEAFVKGAQWADQNKKYPETYDELVRVEAKLAIAVLGFETIKKNYMTGTTAYTIAEHYLTKIKGDK